MSQEHHVLYERLDAVHARDLFALVRPAWNLAALRLGIATALSLGAQHFWRLYGDLVPAN